MPDFLESLVEQTQSMRVPLAGDAPGGGDPSTDPQFERIKAEIDKLGSVSGGAPDWGNVVRDGEDLLATKAKDLRVAIWVACGATERNGWGGLARALVVLRTLIDEYWDTMWPPPRREKARINVVVWFGERFAPRVAELQVDRSSADAVRACAALVEEIDARLIAKLGDPYPGLGSLRSAMRSRVADIPPPPPAPPPSVDTAAAPASSEWADDDEPAPKPAPTTSGPGAVSLSIAVEDAVTTVASCSDALVKLARALMSANTASAQAYRLHRVGSWLPFAHPPAVDEGKIAQDPPDAGARDRLSALFASARWTELVLAGEEAFAGSPWWLDPHRLVALALERMGRAHALAREEVGRGVADLARRWPVLTEVAFRDGTPLAAPETREWLQEEVARWQVVSRADDAAKNEDAVIVRRFGDARDLVATGHVAEGLALAAELARRGADGQGRFRGGLALAKLALRAGFPQVARPILDELTAAAERHALEAWDPVLCAQLYGQVVASLNGESAPDAVARSAAAFDRLCRLDPSAAIRARARPPTIAAPLPPLPAPVASPAPMNGDRSPAPRAAPALPATESEWADD
jgi:type VI secretion system protein VasJ